MSDLTDSPQTGDGSTGCSVEELVGRLRRHWQAALEPCLRATLEGADDALFQRAEREDSDTDQDHFFSAMRELRMHREAVTERFNAAIDDALRAHFYGDQAEQSAEPSSSWSIMGRDEVEEDVAIDATASRLRGRCSEILAAVSDQLESVRAATSGTTNPVDPNTVVDAFANALAGVGIAIQPRIIIYKLFERELLGSLAAAYEDLNRELAAAGLGAEPDAPTSEASNEAAADESLAAASAAGAREPLEQLPPEKEVVGLLHRLVAAAHRENAATGPGGGAAGSPGNGSGSGGGAPADGRAVAGVLSALQRSAAQRQSGLMAPDQLKTLVGRGVARRTGGDGIDRSADQTIDIVSMLFEVILEDERLPGVIKGLFARLQIPVLKVALMDRSFLADSGHPARRLFNSLARASLAWQPLDDPDEDPVYRNIRAAVSQVVEQFSYDPQVFEAARSDFEAWQAELQPADRGATTGRAGVESARQQVEAAIEERLASEPDAPDVLGRLLRDAWFKVLFITAVKQGVGTGSWRRNVAVMDRLIWSVRPKTDPLERQRMLDDLPDLLQQLRDGLNSIMYNPASMTSLFHELQNAHLAILEQRPSAPLETVRGPDANRDPADRLIGSPFRDAQEDGSETGEVSSENVVSADFGGTSEAGSGVANGAADSAWDADVVRELKAMPVGSWFEFLDSEGGRSRARLQSRADDGQRYIFINQRGEQAAQYALGELAALVAAGQAAPVDDEALFDRAIESVIAQLQQKAG